MENKCIVVVIGHSSIDTLAPEYVEAVIPIQTILVADPGLECFADNLEVQSDILQLFLQFDFFARSPQEILTALNLKMKSDLSYEERRLPKTPTKEDMARIHFLRSRGVISRRSPEYYNKTWEFISPNGPEQYGCVLLIHPGPEGLVMEQLYAEQIRNGGFEVTKEELVDELSEDYDSLLFLDIGCNTTNGPPGEFIRRGTFGGKTRKYRK